MAGKTAAECRFIDLYSCFPSAVEIACEELGIAEDVPRGLTEAEVLQDFQDREGLGRAGLVRHADGLNTFYPG